MFSDRLLELYPPTRSSNEAARLHHPARRGGGGLAARGARAAAHAGDRISSWPPGKSPPQPQRLSLLRNESCGELEKDARQAVEEFLESVRKHQAGLQSFRSMRRIEASRRNASALRLRFSQSFASLRQRLSQAKVRSTTQRRGSTTNPFVRSERLTISVSSCGKIFAKAF